MAMGIIGVPVVEIEAPEHAAKPVRALLDAFSLQIQQGLEVIYRGGKPYYRAYLSGDKRSYIITEKAMHPDNVLINTPVVKLHYTWDESYWKPVSARQLHASF